MASRAAINGSMRSFPLAHFVLRTVTENGPSQRRRLGRFDAHGVTKPVTLHVSFNGAGTNPLDKAYTAGFDARGVIKRSDFGVTKYVPLVGDEVDLIISAAFEHKIKPDLSAPSSGFLTKARPSLVPSNPHAYKHREERRCASRPLLMPHFTKKRSIIPTLCV